MKGIKNMKDNFKLDYEAIGDCYYDVYTKPQNHQNIIRSSQDFKTIQLLLKDMAKILNGELTAADYRNEIKQWVSERSDECYLDQGKVRRYDERHA